MGDGIGLHSESIQGTTLSELFTEHETLDILVEK